MKKYLPFILIIAGLLMSFNGPLTGLVAPATLDVKISRPPIIMPAIYKVYGNEDALEGKYSLFKMVITNTSSVPAKNVEVTYKVNNYLDWTIAKKIPLIMPGQTVVVNAYPAFPDKIVEKTTDSKEMVNTLVKGSNVSAIENDFTIPIKGRNEFMYTFLPSDEIRTPDEYFDNMKLVSCYVTPEDPIIKYFTQQIQEKVLKGETASVTQTDKENVRFMLGIYYATLVSHMVYSGTSGVPASISDVNSIVQNIRLPREVIIGKTGLCIELSIMYASIMACAGMEPIIYMIPGHAFPGFRLKGNYYAIESTSIGGEGIGGSKSPEQAFEVGMKELQDFFQKAQAGDPRYFIVDVREAIKQGANAMELKDDAFLRQKIDEIARSFSTNAVAANVNTAPNSGTTVDNSGGGGNEGGGGNTDADNSGGNSGGNSRVIPSGYKAYNGVVNFYYPSSWHLRKGSVIPELKEVANNPANTVFTEVYKFNGYQSPQQALQYMQQIISTNYGGMLQYQPSGQMRNYQLYNGTTQVNDILLGWVAAFKPTSSGIVGIVAGANQQAGNQTRTIANIINSLQ